MTVDFEPPPAPGLLGRCAAWLLRALGWRVRLAQPLPAKCVIIVYPHTSNWDFVLGLCAVWAIGLDVRWVGKDSLFRWPFARLFERWGGIPVKRGARAGFIGQLGDAFARHDVFRVVFAPEGTRARTSHWKSGFYHLARAVDVPLGLGFIDYGKRQLGIGAWIGLSGALAVDLAAIAAFYADKRGCRPELAAPIRFDDGAAEPPGT